MSFMNESEALALFEPFEALIFDFGGIWVDIHYDRTVQAFARLGSAVDFHQLYAQKNQSPLFDQFETGKISENEFISGIQNLACLKETPPALIREAWIQMLGELPLRRIQLLEKISRSKRIFLLSNINSIHETELERFFRLDPERNGFYGLFEKIYFSHRVGMRKPEPEIFNHVLRDSNLNPERTLFMDDSIQHIETARSLGIATHWLNPSNSLLGI